MALYFTTNHKIHARNIVEDGTGVNSQLPFNNDTTETLHVGEIHEGYSFIKYDHGSARLLQCKEIVEDTSSSSGTTVQPSWHTIYGPISPDFNNDLYYSYDNDEIVITNNTANGPYGTPIWNEGEDNIPTILIGGINLDATQLQITYEWLVRDISNNEILPSYYQYGSFILTRNVDYDVSTGNNSNLGYNNEYLGTLNVILKLTTNGTLTVTNTSIMEGYNGYQDIHISRIEVYY